MSAIVSNELELKLLRRLESAANRMFEFSEWEQGLDEDAALAVRKLKDMVDDLNNYRQLLKKTHKD